MAKGKIIIVSGPSGVGKGRVNTELIKNEKLNLSFSISMTTRAPRVGEIHGVNYLFASKEEFEEEIKKDGFIEYAEFLGNYYGTPKAEVYRQLNQGKNVVLEIEVIGATQVLKKEKNVVSIFLMPPNLKVLENRLRTRGTESEAIIKERLNKALAEIPLKKKYKYVIENDDVNVVLAKIEDVLLKEKAVRGSKEPSQYEQLVKDIQKFIDNKYNFFIAGWEENLKRNQIKIPANVNLNNHLIKFLADKIYDYVLRNEDIKILKDPEFIDNIAEYFLLEVDFFKVRQ
ncbi:guanylate kinase [Spiroplasma endosymbiont of Crioceris asparagi]|uniref:guanylate kinase n=1 Tax=Spiroplasma endosymbiont of Crioceris asparagi TaxID=3066286 RepID=UPI0030D4CD9B